MSQKIKLLKAGFFAIGLVIIQGCSFYQFRVQEARNSLRSGQYAKAAESLKERALKESDDQLIYILDYALALQYAGRLDESNKMFQRADQISEVKDYHSISRIAGSFLLSAELVQYKGEDFEKVLINAFGAINYLLLGHLDEALVEARRLNEKLQLYKDEAKKKYEQNAFARYVSAMAWESDGKFDDAYIDYAEAYRLKPSFIRLREDLIRSATQARRGRDEKKWRAEFANVKLDDRWKSGEYGEIVLIYQQGWGPVKRPHPAWHRIPKLYRVPAVTKKAELVVDGQTVSRTQSIYSIQDTAVKTLDDAYAGLVAKRVAGRVAKHAVAHQIGKKNKALGNLALFAMSVVDQADLRQWSTLPAELHISRVYAKAGSHQVSARGLNAYGVPTGEVMGVQNVDVKPGQKVFLNWRSLR